VRPPGIALKDEGTPGSCTGPQIASQAIEKRESAPGFCAAPCAVAYGRWQLASRGNRSASRWNPSVWNRRGPGA